MLCSFSSTLGYSYVQSSLQLTAVKPLSTCWSIIKCGLIFFLLVSSVCLAKEGISGEHRDRVFHKIEDKFLQFIEESNQKVVLKIVIYLYHIVVSASDGR